MNPSPADALHFLHVEDCSHDGEQVRQVIRTEWPESSVTLARGEGELMAAVTKQRFDLVLWDYRMPEFLRLLAGIRKRMPFAPFLFLAGSTGEERPPVNLELGARDYLVVGGIGHLVASVQRALRSGFAPPLRQTTWGSQPPMPFSPQSGHGEFVLVIDDEKYIAEMIGTYLVRFGYRPLVAASAAAGIDLMRRHESDVKLVLTDMLMPEMACDDLLDALRQIKPDVKVVLMTGKPGSGTFEKIAALGCAGFLPKPMSGHEIAQVVGGALASEARA